MPIINPWVFYLISLLDSAKILVEILLTIIIIYCGIVGIATLVSWLTDLCEDVVNVLKTCKIKIMVIALFSLSIIYIIIPTQQTMYTMLVASQVTTENLEIAGDVIQDSVDYILNKMNEGDKEK